MNIIYFQYVVNMLLLFGKEIDKKMARAEPNKRTQQS